MEMGKLTAKLRDAVPVCLLVEGKEIKRYKNIEIPDELKKLEYRDFKFDVPLNGAITFKIMFEPGVLPEEFPQTRERRTRRPIPQGTEPQEAAPAMDVASEERQPAGSLPVETVEALEQALEDAQAAGELVNALAEAVTNGETIMTEIIGDEGEGRLVVITVKPEVTEAAVEAEAQPKDNKPSKKPKSKDKGKKSVTATEDTA